MRLIQRVRLAIQGNELFSGLGHAHFDPTMQFGKIISVKWLSGFEHHVIRDVDDIINGANSGSRQPRTQPGRTRSDFDAPDLLETDERTAVGCGDADLRRIDNDFWIGALL